MNKEKKVFRLLKHQVDFVNSTSPRFIGLVGGFRSGKTVALCHKAIKLCQLNPGLNGALLEPVQSMIRKTLMPVLKMALETTGVKYTYKKSNPECVVLHLPKGDSTIFLLGAENYDRLAGMTLAWFGMDEVDRMRDKELAIAAFNECTARLTAGPVVQGFVTSTPEGFHFMHHFYVKNAKDDEGNERKDRRLIRVATMNNPYVPRSYEERIRSNYPVKQAEAYLMGEFINMASGNVYYCFDRAENKTDVTLDSFPHHILHIGLDFNVGKMSATIAIMTDEGNVYIVDEIVNEANTEAMIKEIKRRYPNRKVMIYPDSSGKSASANASQSSISMLLRAFGPGTCFYRGNNPSIMKERVPAVNAMFRNAAGVRRCFVNVNKCPTLVEGLEQQGFDASGKPDKNSGHDHCLDALGYFLHYRFPVVGKGSLTIVR